MFGGSSSDKGDKKNLLAKDGHEKKPDIILARNEPTKFTTLLGEVTRGQLMFIIWVGWLSIGTIYYGCGNLGLGFCKGFYMSVNSGYSIGWGYPYEDLDSEYAFSIYHVIVGASLVGLALGYFGDQAMADQNGWSTDYKDRHEYEERWNTANWWKRIRLFHGRYWEKCRIVYLWLGFVLFGALLPICEFGWSFMASLYFSISSMSTGGLKAIDQDSPDWLYFITGLFSAIGVPLMGLAMGTVAGGFLGHDTLEDVEKILNEPITKVELDEMKALHGLGFGDEVDKHEFCLLQAVRLGYMDPETIQIMCKKFDSFSRNPKGELTFDAIIKSTADLKEKEKETELNPMQSKA